MARSGGDGLYKRPDSEVFWISYIDANGTRRRESTKTTDRETAKRILDDRRGRVARGEILLPRVDRVTYDEGRADLLAYYETHGTRDLAEAKARLTHLETFFTGRKGTSHTGPGPSSFCFRVSPTGERLHRKGRPGE